jgi:hypothetical protein
VSVVAGIAGRNCVRSHASSSPSPRRCRSPARSGAPRARGRARPRRDRSPSCRAPAREPCAAARCRLDVTTVEVEAPHRGREGVEQPADEVALADPAGPVHERDEERRLVGGRRREQRADSPARAPPGRGPPTRPCGRQLSSSSRRPPTVRRTPAA